MNIQKNAWEIGLFAFVAFSFYKKAAFFDQSWAELILIYGVLVLAPIAVHLYQKIAIPRLRLLLDAVVPFQLPAALSFAVAFSLEPSGLAAFLVVPWLVFSFIFAFDGLISLKNASAAPHTLMTALAAVFFAVGPTWAFFDRASIPFMGYDAALVLLTAVHFHFAGFFFPILVAFIHKKRQAKSSAWAIYLFALGVPLTAVGISLGHFYKNYMVEALSASFVVLAVLLVVFNQLKVAFELKTNAWSRLCLGLSALLFVFAMSLALAYAFRDVLAWSFFTIPNLRFYHGTANLLALSFAYLGLILAKIDKTA